ncbi:hypothetical protein MRB53_019468 [Persea americana]|uniref:Uncharacterized protein n=1 Tax=Persea americana TaxID=3435 RepID=A0ACC2KYC5_PERAE|nr:hypothetical protein MRB53_019468 [Persea americana]
MVIHGRLSHPTVPRRPTTTTKLQKPLATLRSLLLRQGGIDREKRLVEIEEEEGENGRRSSSARRSRGRFQDKGMEHDWRPQLQA